MESNGFVWPLILAQLTNMMLIVIWLVATGLALRHLRRRQLREGVRVVWTLIVLCVPLLGTLAFFIVQPGKTLASN